MPIRHQNASAYGVFMDDEDGDDTYFLDDLRADPEWLGGDEIIAIPTSAVRLA